MTIENEIDDLYSMCKDLRNEVAHLNHNVISSLKEEIADLKAVVKALVESNNKKSVAIKEVVDNSNLLSEEVNKALDDNEEKVVQLSAEVEEIREHVKSAEIKHKTTVAKIKALETSVKPGRAFSVQTHHFRPQYRYHQFKGPRPRICYNCRKQGHEARNCDRPNPRMDAINAAKTLSVGVAVQEEEVCPWEQEYQASLLKERNERSVQS